MAEICLAPMLKVTTPLFRLLMRKISPKTWLFTEMIVASTVIHVSKEKLKILLGDPDDLTVVQLGGSCPKDIAKSVVILKEMGWNHFNLNCGCPSDRVQSGKFGAVLMLEPKLVADIINEVYMTTGIILSLKIRTGVDENDSFDFFKNFVQFIIENTKCNRFYVHARKCWLCGLSPKQNRNIPSLSYQYVYDIKNMFPNVFFSLNGGIKANEIHKLGNLDGMMIGRAAQDNLRIFNSYENEDCDMKKAVKEYFNSITDLGCPKTKILMPLNNLRKGLPRNREFKQKLNDLMQSDMSLSEIYDILEEFID